LLIFIFKEYEKQVEEFDEMRKKEDKARAVRQQIIADMHRKSDNTKDKKKNKTTKIVKIFVIINIIIILVFPYEFGCF
jgi:hypothetical protein